MFSTGFLISKMNHLTLLLTTIYNEGSLMYLCACVYVQSSYYIFTLSIILILSLNASDTICFMIWLYLCHWHFIIIVNLIISGGN